MLKTDANQEIPSTPAHPLTDNNKETREKNLERDRKRFLGPDDKRFNPPGHMVKDDLSDTTTNCLGVVFDRAKSAIDPAEGGKILAANYKSVTAPHNATDAADKTHFSPAQVCDIIHWGKADAIAHVALVVEVDENGIPTFAWGKDGDASDLWAFPPDLYGKDWFVSRRNPLTDPTAQQEVDKLRKEYEKKRNEWQADPKDEAKREAAQRAAYEMCRRKNALAAS